MDEIKSGRLLLTLNVTQVLQRYWGLLPHPDLRVIPIVHVNLTIRMHSHAGAWERECKPVRVSHAVPTQLPRKTKHQYISGATSTQLRRAPYIGRE